LTPSPSTKTFDGIDCEFGGELELELELKLEELELDELDPDELLVDEELDESELALEDVEESSSPESPCCS
jgi:hypothetical protein